MSVGTPDEAWAPLATSEQLQTYSQEVDVEHADLLLSGASAIVRSWCGWRIAPAGKDSDTALARGGVLLLPTLRLLTLDSLSVDGEPVDVDGWRALPSGIVLPHPTRGWGTWPGWGTGGAVVTATFTHGHPAVPDDVRAVVLAVATRMLLNPAAQAQESLAGYTVTYAGAAAGLLPVERAILDRHRVPGRT